MTMLARRTVSERRLIQTETLDEKTGVALYGQYDQKNRLHRFVQNSLTMCINSMQWVLLLLSIM